MTGGHFEGGSFYTMTPFQEKIEKALIEVSFPAFFSSP